MKFLNKYMLPVVIGLALASCGNTTNNSKADKEEETTAAQVPADIPQTTPGISYKDPALRTQLQGIFKGYLDIQTALTKDQAATAATAAVQLNNLITGFNATTLPDSLRAAYDVPAKGIGENAAAIAQHKDIGEQRISFAPLSEQVLRLLRSFGVGKPVFETHCPMAFDNKGANWLSDKPEVRNPYFGDQMLECGEITAIIKAQQ